MARPDGRFQYNRPPNWPAAPEGWAPPEGWVPPPEWGPAPEGWVLWLPVEPAPMPSEPKAKNHRKTWAEIGQEQAESG